MSLISPAKSLPVSGPCCTKCDLPMLLSEVQSDKRKWEIHLFECPQCHAQEAHVVKKVRI
jgi:hypothetical protein